MKKHFTNLRNVLVGFLVCLMSMSMMAQTPAVTLDFTTNDWGFPTSAKATAQASFTNTAGYTIILEGTTGNGYRWYDNYQYLLNGQTGATLTLPAFDFAVEKIEVVGREGASTATQQNIFVGDVAVSTATTGAAGTNEYLIDENYQAAGNIYVLKVLNNKNTQITYINIYAVATPEPPTPIVVAVPTFAPEAGTYTAAQNVTIACATEGASIYYTIDGTTPTANSTLYENAIEITETTTINAIAFVGETASDVATATYTINVTPIEPDEPTVLDLDSIATLPYVYNFEGVDPYFMINNGEATNAWYIGQAQGFDNNKLYISSNGGTTNKYDITAASTVTAYRDVMIPATGAVLSFDYRVNGQTSTTDYLKLDLNGTEIARLYGENEWASFSYDISGEMAGEVRVQFTWVNNATNGNQFPAAIDNISIVETPCSQPTNLLAAVDGSTTVVITWEAVEGQTAWNLQYKLADHSEWYTVPATDTTVTLTDLQGNSNYQMRVQAVCGENLSAWTNGTFAVACQEEVEMTLPTDVVIGTNTATTSYIFPGFYGWQYSASLYDMENAGPINSIAFYLNSASTTTGSTMTVWVKAVPSDYALAASTTFATMVDGAQQIYDGAPDFSTAGWITFPVNNFTLAEGQDLLVLVRGVGCSTSGGCSKAARYTSASNKLWYKLQDSSDPGLSTTGTVSSSRPNITINMDLPTVTCADVVACANPTGLEVSDITPNSAVLTWTAGAEGQNNFIVEYMAEGATEWTSVEVSDTTYTLTELAQLTNYSVKVKANCGTNNWSDVITASFRTVGICTPVTNLETSNVSNTTTLTWTAGGEETAWLVQFKPASAGEEAWTSINVSLIPMTTFGGLVGNVDYDVRVKALCDPENEENQSEWVNASFHSGCAAFDLPFAEEFPTNTMPVCWENQDFHFSSSSYAYSYTNGAELITPAINIPAENPTYLTFEVRGAGDYTVLASYRGTRADRFAEIYTGTAPNQNTVVTIEIDDLYKGRAVNFKIVNNSTSYQYFYNVKVNQCPFEVAALNVAAYTGNTVDLAWEADEIATNFQVQYGEAGFTLGEGTSVNVTDTTATTVNGLNYETAYDFYVRVVCAGDNGAWFGPISATTAPSCSDPTITEYEFNNGSLMVFWTAGEWGTPSQYNVRYKGENEEEYNYTTVIPVDMPEYTPFVTISGLASNAHYEFGVQAHCGENMESNWVSMELTTPCLPLAIPYAQDFEGDVFPPECWSQVYVSGTQDWEATVDASYGSGTNDASFTYYNASGNTTMLLSPAFDLSTYTTTGVVLRFAHSQAEWAGDQDEMNVYYRTSANGSWVLLQAYTNSITSMTAEEILLPAAALTSYCQIAFEAVTNYGHGVFVDDFSLDVAPACGTPTITVVGLNATITPNTQFGTPTAYELMIGEETQTVTSTTVDLHTVFPSLELNTAYQISVRTICSGNETSEWFGPVDFTTPQCWESCIYTVEMTDSYGDGWNGNAIYVMVDGVQQQSITLDDGSTGTANILVCSGAVSFVWHTGSYADEASFIIKNEAGTSVYTCSDGSDLSDGQEIYATYCGTYPACGMPSISVNNMIATITPSEYATTTPHSYELMVEGESHVVTTTTVDLSTIFTTLESSSTYEVIVRAYCGDSDTSGWSAAVEFVTPCLAVNLPLVEDFEATASVFPSTCWTSYKVSGNGTKNWASTTSYKHSGSRAAVIPDQSNMTVHNLVTPLINVPNSGAILKFWVKRESNYATKYEEGVKVLYGANQDGTGATELLHIHRNYTLQPVEASAAWYEYSTTIPAGQHYVIFQGINEYGGATYIDDIEISEVPACMYPSAITLGTVTETTAEVSWTAGGSETEWEVSYTLNDQVYTETTSNNPYTITGLTASTHYVIPFSVKAICSETEESEVVSKDLTFDTECALVAVPYSENFDAYPGATSQASMVMPVCWNRKYTGTSTTYGAGIYNGSSYAVSGTNSLRLYNYGTTSTSTSYGEAYAVMPELDAALNTLMISFDAKRNTSTSTTYGSLFEVGVVTDPTSPETTFTTIQTLSAPIAGERFTVSLADYDGTGHIAFRATKAFPSGYTSTYFYNYTFIDNLVVEAIPTCFVPTALTVSDVTDHTAQVSWTDNYNQTNFAVEYKAEGEDTWTTINTTTTTCPLSNLAASTEYTVRVKAVCGTDDESEYTDEITFTTVCEHGVTTTIAGTGGTTYYLPIDNYYHYSYTQQIIDAEEMGGTGIISTIAFEYNYATPMSAKNNVKIYLGTTDKTVFSSTTDWVTSGLQEVYSGALNCSQGWNEFALTTPFNYNGGNVVVVIEDMSDAYDGNSYTFKQTSTSGYKGMYYHNDNNPFTGSNTASGRTTYRSNMKLIGCPDPYDVAVVEVNNIPDACEVEGAVAVKVQNNGYEPVSAFSVSYQLNDATPVQENVTLSTPLAMGESTIHTFAQLPTFVEGSYTITASVAMEGDAVEANNSLTSDPIVVLAPATVPYEEAFTGLTINHGWNPIDANNDGITMNLNNDINYTFNDLAAADDWMMSPCIELPAGTYTVYYDYKANSSLTEAFEVFYGNGNHVTDMTNAVATHSFNNTTYETASATITIAADGVYNFGFHATSLAGNLGFSIDNFKVYPVNDVVVTYNELGGTVTPNGTVAVNYGENLTLNLVPEPMYHVAGVWVDDVQVVPEDGTGANFMLYTLENVTEPHTVYVDYKLEFHIIKSVENYRADLYSDLGGAFVPAATDTTINPDPFTVNMVADPHYHLAGLTKSPMVPDMQEDVFVYVTDNGDGTYSYTIDTLVVANYYLNATFRRDTVAIHYNVLTGKGHVNDSEELNTGESYTTWVDYSVNQDVDTTVTFTADAPYYVAEVIVNGESQGRIEEYTFVDVTTTQTVDVKYGYKIDAFVSNYNTYDEITDVMGTIEPETQYVPEFSSMTVTGTVAEHFHLYQLLVNGVNRIDEVVFDADPHSYSFTMDSVSDNYVIEAKVKVDTFAIIYNIMAGQGYADESELLDATEEMVTYYNIHNYGDNWYSNIIPATGYSIANVTLDGQNLYTASNYQFNYLETSHVFTVDFAPVTYTITTNAFGNGTVTDGMSFTYDPENPVDYVFNATAAEGYYIASVTINNVAQDITDVEDTYTDTIHNVADNYTINVIFQMYTYTMTAEASQGGTITPNGTQVVNYGTDVNYEITANEGWYIAQTVIDGVTTEYTQDSAYTEMEVPFTGVNTSHTVGVVFNQYVFTITATADVNGTITPDGQTTVTYGDNLMVNIAANSNYHIADVLVDGVSVGAVESYEFINITEDHTISATFDSTMYTLTATSNVDACTISPDTITVQAGQDVTYTLTVANGYHLVGVTANGQAVTVTNDTFTITNVQSDYTILAVFVQNNVTVTVNQPQHATITPGTQTYTYGATPSYMIVPEVGYEVVSVTAGNEVVSVAYNNGIGTFTLAALEQNITLTATTAKKQFTITVTQGDHGTITPATQTVEYGDNVTFTITPDDYYVTLNVVVDSSNRGALSTYTFYNVTSNHTITAEFEGDCQMPTNLVAMDIDTTSATLTWVGTASSYEVEYKAVNESTYHSQTVDDNFLALTGLTPNTLYGWRVRSICGTELTSDWAVNAFTTKAIPVTPIDPTSIVNAAMLNVKVYSHLNNVYIVNEDGLAISDVAIYDIYGKQVYTGKVTSSSEVISLNVANGNYVVRLATENGVGVYKVAIVR